MAKSTPKASGEADPIAFKRLYDTPADPSARADWNNQLVKVRGQIAVNPKDPRFFELVRFRGACCAADAQRLEILCASKEPIVGLKAESWVEVTAKVQYAGAGQSARVRLLVSRADNVKLVPPDPNPYVQ